VAWYREWFGQEYLELYAHHDVEEAERHLDFVEARLGGDPPPRAVLDLACGAGRHTEALRRRGYRALGVDLSLTLLAQRPHLPRVGGDMCCLPFADGTFDWVLNFFTSFGYFETERENFQVLAEIVRVLAPGGRFLIDFLNLDRVLAELEPRETQVSEDGRRVEIERWFDPTARRINKRIRVETPEEPPRTFLESVRGYRRDEVVMGLGWAGLELMESYGNFDGDPFERDSPRLILVGRKPD
jgi:SAM-dependent methyltransferase